MHGLHRSPYLGMSVEFASHREYTPGDDLRHLNWKLYARHDRLYIKEYDADTNLNLYLLLDASASMSCAKPAGASCTTRHPWRPPWPTWRSSSATPSA